MLVSNPILPGWHPDPCICTGPDGWYYLVTSTFQWVPAVSCYRSRDLVRWESMGGLLTELDLRGMPDSAGVWAPDLTYADGVFWLVYSVLRNIDGIFKDVENYVVTAPSVEGPWSEPVFLNASGFDPGLYHEDGRHYVLNPQWDPRPLPGHRRFNGLILQEFDLEHGLLGGARKVLDNDDAVNGLREGPHILKHDGWYYIACAEGGTGRRHRIRMARSRELWGPYEVCPEPLVCAWQTGAVLRKAGHGNLVQGPDGSWYVCHLCSRYLPGSARGKSADGTYGSDEAGLSPLGRETALQKVMWRDGWPCLTCDGVAPRDIVEIGANPSLRGAPLRRETRYATSFEGGCDLWREEWLAPRHVDGWLRFVPAGIELRGAESPSSLFDQALIARRQTSFAFEAETSLVDFGPRHYNQSAGLICLYDTRAFHYLSLGYDEVLDRRVIDVLSCDNGDFSMPLGKEGRIWVPDGARVVRLGVRVEGAGLIFSYGFDEEATRPVSLGGKELVLDASILSDEHVAGWAYTGAMVGITCVDMYDKTARATFGSFSYRDLEGWSA